MAYKVNHLRRIHKQTIKEYFYREKVCNKNILSEETKISRTTCTTIIRELLEEEFIVQIENDISTGGRPRKQYQLNKDYEHYCLVSLENGEPLTIRIEVRNLYSECVCRIDRACSGYSEAELYEMLDDIFADDSKIVGIAVSVPGVIDQKGTVLACDIKELERKNPAELLNRRYGVGALVENDVNLAVIGGYRGENSLAFLYQPELMYSGCGIMLNHQLYRGSTLFAGEVGYLAGCAGIQPKDREGAKEILIRQLAALICVINPETILVHSAYGIRMQEIWTELEQLIEMRHLPLIKVVDGLETYIFDGLMEASMELRKES